MATYLTIDDAPSSDFLSKVSYLSEQNIPAIFFCEGRKIDERFDQVVSAIKHGFIIGNHTYSHPSLSRNPVAQVKEEIQETEELIERAYEEAGVERDLKVFRYPYGDTAPETPSKNEALQTFFKQMDFSSPPNSHHLDWRWTFDVKAYETQDLETLKSRIEMENWSSPAIVLIHDHENTTHLFESLIETLQTKDSFVSASE